MRKWFKFVAAIIISAASSSVFASETNMLLDKLVEKGVITSGEANLISAEGKQETLNALAKGKIDTLPKWIQNITMKGDIRLRQQSDWDASKNYERSRQRLRLRTGFETMAVENLKAGFGIATGGESLSGTSIIDAEPTSTNHTFSNGFAKSMLMVDFAFLEYTPLPWLKVTGGKMKAGTQVWHTTDLLWDTDINPDGIAITASQKFGSTDLFLTAGWLIFNELNSTSNNPDAYIVQPGVKVRVNDNIDVKAAAAFENLNVNGKNTGYYGTPSFDYICLNPSAEISVKGFVFPYLSLFTDMVSNSDSKPTSDKNGSAYGIKFGSPKISELGTWQFKYMQRSLESNSWLNKLGDADAYGGAVNSSGYEAAVDCGLTKAASLSIDYYSMDKITGASAPKSLLQFDVVYKF